MNVLLLKCGLPHDTVIVCVRDILVSRGRVPFGGSEVFYYVPNVTHPAQKRSVCTGLKRGDPGNEIDPASYPDVSL